MSDYRERACTNCGSYVHHEDDCPSSQTIAKPLVMRRQDWECNQCGFKEYTDAVSQSELDQWLQCSNCGGDEFHLVPVFDGA